MEESVLSEHTHDKQLKSLDEVKEPKLKFAIVLTSVILVGELIGGWWTGSLAQLRHQTLQDAQGIVAGMRLS